MSKQREALQVALEAINSLWNIIDDIDTASDIAKFDDRLYRNQVESLQARRWRLDISTGGQLLIGKVINKIREALAEPEQKPVAVVTSQTGDPAITMSWHHEPALPIGTKLYTTPPARKPLTDEQIDKIIASNVTITDKYLLEAVHMAIREVEAAHGIDSD